MIRQISITLVAVYLIMLCLVTALDIKNRGFLTGMKYSYFSILLFIVLLASSLIFFGDPQFDDTMELLGVFVSFLLASTLTWLVMWFGYPTFGRKNAWSDTEGRFFIVSLPIVNLAFIVLLVCTRLTTGYQRVSGGTD